MRGDLLDGDTARVGLFDGHAVTLEWLLKVLRRRRPY